MLSTLGSRRRVLTIAVAVASLLTGIDCRSGPGESSLSPTTGEASLDEALDVRDPSGILRVVDSLSEESRLATRARQESIADHLTEAAIQLFNARRTGLAESCINSALVILRRQSPVDAARLAASLGLLGDVLWARNQYGAADRALEEALSILDHLPTSSDTDLVLVLNTLGDTRRALGRYADAAAFLMRAQGIAEHPDMHQLLVSVLNNLAGLDRDHGRFADAESKLQRSLDLRLSAQPPDDIAVAAARFNLGEVYRLARNYDAAEPQYIQALEIARSAPEMDKQRLAFFVSQFSQLRAEQGRIDEAEVGYREALSLRVAALAPAPERAQTLDELGRLLRKVGRTGDAIKALTEAHTILENDPNIGRAEGAATLVALAAARSAQGDEGPSVAETMVIDALRVLESTGVRLDARIDAYALRADLWWRRGAKAHAYMSLDRAISTAEHLRAQSGGGVLTRAEYQKQWLKLYDRMIAWRLADAPDTAFMYAERARARVLLDELAASGADLEAGIPSDVLDPLRRRRLALEDEAAALRAGLADPDSAKPFAEGGTRDEERLHGIVEELALLLERIRNESPTWRRAAGSPLTTVAQLQKDAVPTGGTLLLYHVGDEAIWLFELRPFPDRVRASRLSLSPADADTLGCPPGPIGRACLDGLIASPDAGLLQAISHDPLALTGVGEPSQTRALAGDALLQRLQLAWRVLIPVPVRERLLASGAGPVVIVPDGVLRHFPFEALVVNRRGTGEPIHWLDIAPPIVYAESASAVAELGHRSAGRSIGPPVYLTVGGAVFTRREDSAGNPRSATVSMISGAQAAETGVAAPLGALRWSIEESRAVEARLRTADPDGTFVALRGPSATEALVTEALPRARIIHLATHGIVNPDESAYFASLAFTPPPRVVSGSDDGFLRLYEIYRLQLQADIAVLSACYGQVGRDVEGEGVFALSRGFLATGSDRVIASLWEVDDAATGELVDRLFFHGLAAGGHKHAENWPLALRNAKREVRAYEEWRNPYYWAAFTYQGVAQVSLIGNGANQDRQSCRERVSSIYAGG